MKRNVVRNAFNTVADTANSVTKVIGCFNRAITIGSDRLENLARTQRIRLENQRKQYMLINEKQCALNVAKVYTQVDEFRSKSERHQELYDGALEEFKAIN